jgi:5'(3')-deoxyribonucleotidase
MIQIETPYKWEEGYLVPYKLERPKPKILVDIDGVIAQYDFPKIVKDFFGIDLSSQVIFAYDLADVLGVAPKLIDLMFRKQVFGKANLMPGALKILGDFSKKYEIIIYTNRTKYMTSIELVTWLIENEIPFDGIDYCPEQRYYAHIDDSPSKLASTNSGIKILFNQPWNTHCVDAQKQFLRVGSWSEIRRFL